MTILEFLASIAGQNADELVAWLESIKRDYPDTAPEVDAKLAFLNTAISPEGLVAAGQRIMQALGNLGAGKLDPKDSPSGSI